MAQRNASILPTDLLWLKKAPNAFQLPEKGRWTVVEFWAQWCPPCRQTIPHLTELAHKYPEVHFLGITTEDANTRSFVAQMGDQMDYSVAIDPHGHAHESYMRAFQQRGIPCCFLVSPDLKVRWVGHPGQLEDHLIQERGEEEQQRKALLDMGFTPAQVSAAIANVPENDIDIRAVWITDHPEAALESSASPDGHRLGKTSPDADGSHGSRLLGGDIPPAPAPAPLVIPPEEAMLNNEALVRQRQEEFRRKQAEEARHKEQLRKQREAERAARQHPPPPPPGAQRTPVPPSAEPAPTDRCQVLIRLTSGSPIQLSLAAGDSLRQLRAAVLRVAPSEPRDFVFCLPFPQKVLQDESVSFGSLNLGPRASLICRRASSSSAPKQGTTDYFQMRRAPSPPPDNIMRPAPGGG